MKKTFYTSLFSWVLMLMIPIGLMGQGITTSSMSGTVNDAGGEALIGANVVAVHQPSGTSYGTITDINGLYRIPNMRVGGPYTVTVSYLGYEDNIVNNIILRLGEPFKLNVGLSEGTTLLDEIVVTSRSGTVGTSSGSSTQISADAIDNMPTLNRDIDDFLRLTPQSRGIAGGTSFAGVNNRFNAIYIDGAVNNDVFGLASSGTNGGQTGIAPFSIDIIEQLQVVLSPYDVSLGGFAGGGVNAVTKSGTNSFEGTAYYFMQNENLVGKTNGELADRLGLTERTKVDEFSKKTYGFSLGGPIAKDKAFFFFNAELQKDETPRPFETSVYTGEPNRASESDLNNLASFLQNTYGYDPGTFGNTSDELEGTKLFGKIDVNLNENHKLTLRHQYTKAEEFDRNSGSSNRINFSNNGVFFPSTTNSSAIELNSNFGNNMSNNLILGYTNVQDDRGSLGDDFPFVIIDDGNGSIRFGTEPFSTANILKQKIFSITNNLKLYKGKHTITIGTHNEFYDIFNLFMPWNYGQYEYNSLDDFLTGAPADSYRRVYSLVDEFSGDLSSAAAEFKAMQLGFYGQDQIEVNDRLSITAGLRIDIPVITDDPGEAPRFNDEVLPRLAQSYEIAEEVEAGKAPEGQIMFSPRFGFDYALSEDKSSTLRGGIGIFTSRIPFVWPGAMFNTNGLTSTFLGDFAIPGDVLFIPEIQDQYTYENPTVPSGDMNLFTKDFKYPQILRGNLAWDKEYGDGWFTSIEGLYTKTLNNIVMTNINTSTVVDFNWTGSGDDRPVFVRSEIDEDAFGAVYVASNTSDGYTYNITTSIAKQFDFGLNASLAWSFTEAKSINEGTSSQNSSQWRGQIHIDGRNNPVYGRSDYAAGHRLMGSFDYTVNWGGNDNISTRFSLYYNGQSGEAFSYVIGSRSAQNINNQRGSASRNRSLVYVPADQNDINFIDFTLSDGTVVTAAEQWTNLNALIEDDPSLSSRRGQYAEKNGARAPWTNRFDFAIKQNLGKDLGGDMHRLQLSLDFFNFANLINKNWGTFYNVPGDFNNYFLYDFEGYAADGTTPQFTYSDDDLGSDRYDISNLGSRWSMRLGFRYLFN